MSITKFTKLSLFSATLLFAGFLFTNNAKAVENVSLVVQPATAPLGTTQINVGGSFNIPMWVPFCGPFGQTAYARWYRRDLVVGYAVFNSISGEQVHAGRQFDSSEYTRGFTPSDIDCGTSYNGTFDNTVRYNFVPGGINIPIPSNLTTGQYEVRVYSVASPEGECDPDYWDYGGNPEGDLHVENCAEYTYADEAGLTFYIEAAPPGTVSVYSNQNTCFDVSGPTNPAPFCLNTAPDTKAYPNMTEGQYSITAEDVPCYNKTIQNSTQTLASGSSITFNIIYSSDGSCGEPDPGTINVTSNLSTSWTISGAGSYNGSGTSGTYSSAPLGEYTISAPAISGYALTITPSATQTLNDGGSVTFNLQYSVTGACSDNSTVTLVSGLPATLDPGQTYQFTARIGNTGSTWWYHGSAYQLIQKNTSYNMNHNGLPYGHIGSSVHTSGHLGYVDTRDINFTLVAPTTPGNYSIPLQMVHNGYGYWPSKYDNGADCGTGPMGEPQTFGQLLNVPFTVGGVVGGNSITFSITYSPSPLVAPTGVSVSHACNAGTPTMTVNWSYTSNGAEDGFYVYRSTNDADWTLVSGLLGTGVRTFQNVPPTPNIRYYYRVSTHRALNIEPREVYSASADAMASACEGNLINSTMSILQVNGQPFSGSTIIKKDDVLTFRIHIINSGPANVQVQRICGNPGDNLINPTNLVANGSGLVNGGMQTTDAECISLGNDGLRFSITGNKDVINNWELRYRTTYSPASDDSQEIICNNAVIYYTDTYAKTKTVTSPCILVNTSTPAPPTFREVAP